MKHRITVSYDLRSLDIGDLQRTLASVLSRLADDRIDNIDYEVHNIKEDSDFIGVPT